MVEFGKRVITAAVLIVVLVNAWLLGGIYLNICLSVVALVASWEFYRMFLREEKQLVCFATFLTALMLVLTFISSDEKAIPIPIYKESALLLCFLLTAILTLFRWVKRDRKAIYEGSIIVFGFVYIPQILLLLTTLSPYEQFFIFALPAVNDTFAYLTGMLIGKHKIWVQVSPKKSVEGSFGGLLASVVFTLIFCGHFGNVGWYPCILLGMSLSIMAQLGDFFESALKRSANVKDSSRILPGHGGVLDRIDSVLFVVPFFYCCMTFFPQIRF